MRIDNYEGERVEVADQSTAELQRIRAEILDDLKRGGIDRGQCDDLDIIDEELDGRS